MREKIEVLEDKSELGFDLAHHLLIAVMDLIILGIAEHIAADNDLAGINAFKDRGAAQERGFAAA